MIEYVQKFDSVPEFWQFIRGLTQDDLISELVQNELDAGSNHTTVHFGANTLTCCGNGDAVDADGWSRLTFLRGAGHLVPRKRRQIGIKNHGIKACFTIGDDINIRSDRKMIRQTLYSDGPDQPPSPGAYPRPKEDDGAPAIGCVIEVPYRAKGLRVDLGEPISLPPVTQTTIEEVFLRACQETPRRFIGALRPDTRRRYVLELEHHRLGIARFEFSCGTMRMSGDLRFYKRKCCTSGTAPRLPETLVEAACLFKVPIQKGSNKEIPDFYAVDDRFFVAEISWLLTGKDRLGSTRGYRRYPLEYSGTDQTAFTGLGVNFSAPYVSDSERHRAAKNDAFNVWIEDACQSTLVRILRLHLIPRYGSPALDLLVDHIAPNETTLRRMVDLMLDASALPIRRPKPVKERTKRNPRQRASAASIRFGPSRSAERRIVLPVLSWEPDRISPSLSKLCPRGEDQIDPSVPGPIIRLLSDGACEGWKRNHITFDESDAVERLQPMEEAGFFPWTTADEWKRDLGDPAVVGSYLDVVAAVYDHEPESEDLVGLVENAYLPDATGTPTPLERLYTGVDIPPNLFADDTPPILHPSIARHRVFRRKDWRRPVFTFGELLERAALHEADFEKRLEFWRWLKNNWRQIKTNRGNPWPTLARLEIWPDTLGELRAISALCQPRGKRLASIMTGSISVPSGDVLRLGPIKKAKRGPLRIRSVPAESEITCFLETRVSRFPLDRALSGQERQDFHSLEGDIAELASDKELRSRLDNNRGYALAVSKSGYVRVARDLVQLSDDSRELNLIENDILERRPSVLDRMESWKPRSFPTSAQVLTALRDDPHRTGVLYRRLRAYLQAAKLEGKIDMKDDIAEIECIPDGDKLYAPLSLAFKSARGDYWGNWKHRISGQGLGADIQQLFKDVGVLGANPTEEGSREFFQWLNAQRTSTLDRNLSCVIRQINHDKGPKSWSPSYPGIPFIPVAVSGGQVCLVSKASAVAKGSMVFIPDHEALAEAIRNSQTNHRIQLVITIHQSVSTPITPYMQQLGIKSLRVCAGNPVAVKTEGAGDATPELLDELRFLCERKMSKELRKRLARMDIPFSYIIRTNWRERLMQVQRVVVASSLAATFKIGRCRYTVQTEAAFDQASNTIYLSEKPGNIDTLFYRAIGERIFEHPTECLSVMLKEAVRREYKEIAVYSGIPDPLELDDWEGYGEEDRDQGGEGSEAEVGGADRTHGGRYPDASKNLPDSGEIPTGIPGPEGRPPVRPSGGSKRKTPRIEQIQIANLKGKQYAWHCQVCLAERPVEQLAPANSYVGIQENRRELIVSSHMDQVHAGGERHAGNILILCTYHHNYLGDRLSRKDITTALKEGASDHTVVFSTSADDETESITVPGKIATIEIPLEGKEIRCFFTEHHADYWLKKA